MPSAPSGPPAPLRSRLVAALLLALGACASPPPPPPPAAAIPKDALPLEEAVVRLAEATLAGARDIPAGTRRALVIDPLIDRATGAETGATRSMVARIETLVRERHPEFELKPFTLAALEERPLILLGAITTVQGAGSLQNAAGPSGTYRIWAVLGDLRTGMILSHPTAWVRADSVDPTPTAFFRDSPVWTEDDGMAAYLRTCAGAPGTPMDPAYLRGLRAQAVVAEAIRAYEAGDLRRARELYAQADGEPGGQQARVLNGLYLTTWALGRPREAAAAFGRVVDYGLARNRLAVKLLFRPGRTEFVRDPGVSGPYPMWLREIADRTVRQDACLLVVGHASVTGAAAANERLSLARAQAVRGRLVADAPPLRQRTQAEGRGGREPIIGLGTDDMRDALDRRVEFAPRPCTRT